MNLIFLIFTSSGKIIFSYSAKISARTSLSVSLHWSIAGVEKCTPHSPHGPQSFFGVNIHSVKKCFPFTETQSSLHVKQGTHRGDYERRFGGRTPSILIGLLLAYSASLKMKAVHYSKSRQSTRLHGVTSKTIKLFITNVTPELVVGFYPEPNEFSPYPFIDLLHDPF